MRTLPDTDIEHPVTVSVPTDAHTLFTLYLKNQTNGHQGNGYGLCNRESNRNTPSMRNNRSPISFIVILILLCYNTFYLYSSRDQLRLMASLKEV
jgi:hypothetical protein